MAQQFHVTVKSAKQGDFKGDIAGKSNNQIAGLGFRDGVSVNVGATGQATGRRQYSPIAFTKAWSGSSPQFLQALATNETLTAVTFEFFKAKPDGTEQTFYTIKLSDASVVRIEQFAGNLNSLSATVPEIEEISLTFRKIQVTSVEGGTGAADDWSGPAV